MLYDDFDFEEETTNPIYLGGRILASALSYFAQDQQLDSIELSRKFDRVLLELDTTNVEELSNAPGISGAMVTRSAAKKAIDGTSKSSGHPGNLTSSGWSASGKKT